MPFEEASAPSFSSVRFDEDDYAIFRMRKPMRRAEALQDRILPKLDAIVSDALDEVRVVHGVEPFEDSIISRWPNFRPRRERDFEHLYPSAFVGVGGQHTLGKWVGVARSDRKPVQIVPFRPGVHFDADGLEVHLHNDWPGSMRNPGTSRCSTWKRICRNTRPCSGPGG